jgi:two-component system OmpR family response regulator
MNAVKTKILLVEENDNFGSILKEYLETKFFLVEKAKNGREAYDLLSNQEYDLCLLDIRVPFKNGFTLIKDNLAITKEIVVNNKKMPIIFLAANSTKKDVINRLNARVFDYITFPFHVEELLTRIHAVLRREVKMRMSDNVPIEFSIGKYTFNTDTQILALGKYECKLTTKEVQLLRLLMLNKNEIVDRSYILETIWGENNYFKSRSMDVFITQLRKHLKNDEKIEIVNVRGKGVKLLI